MHYVNLAAAIDTLADALRKQDQSDIIGTRALLSLQKEFVAGISYTIGMMLDPDTAAIIEAAAKERAQEDTAS